MINKIVWRVGSKKKDCLMTVLKEDQGTPGDETFIIFGG